MPRLHEPSTSTAQTQRGLLQDTSRTRTTRDLFAPSLSRRPTSRATAKSNDKILVDHESEEEEQRPRHVSPELKHGRRRARQHHDEELSMVNCKPSGDYLLSNDMMVLDALEEHMNAPDILKEQDEAAHQVAASRFFFLLPGDGADPENVVKQMAKERSDKHGLYTPEELVEDTKLELRKSALKRLEEERWMFEAEDRYLPRLH
ncbi:hypothetical protein LTR97_001805 [Elasticomyces elasticus]|uniref:Uncharacterized protein n=1 Tax=Elasticomyces elasticus TaxID=574655 RepID=A0AAN7VWP1_9PEZI|nr:hypothetical protein LTR97_001805 [Elasticomyces elasticus]